MWCYVDIYRFFECDHSSCFWCFVDVENFFVEDCGGKWGKVYTFTSN